MKKALLFFLGVVFVCCIYAYGTNERFSVEKWLENVKQIAETATIEDLTECWTKDTYVVEVSGEQGFGRQTVKYEAYEGTNDVLIWLDTMVGFFKRLGRTIKLAAEMLVGVFRNMRLLLPWNATVPIA